MVSGFHGVNVRKKKIREKFNGGELIVRGREKSREETNVRRGSSQHWSEDEKKVGMLKGRKRMGKTSMEMI